MPRSVHIKNVSGAVIPPHSVVAIVQVITVAGRSIVEVDMPLSVSSENFLTTYHINTPVNGMGEAFYPDEIILVSYNTGVTPSVGDLWGPVSGSHKIASSGDGWEICGVDASQGLVHAIKRTDSSGGGAVIIRFRIVSLDQNTGCEEARVLVLGVTCDTMTYLVDTYVTVVDNLGCFFNIPQDMLIGLNGYATKIYSEPEYGEDDNPYDDNCEWEVTSMCCGEENVYYT